MTEEELIQKVKSKEHEINELLQEAHKLGLKVEITQREQTNIKLGQGSGQGARIDLVGYEVPILQITFVR
jgi:hypothetical protein